MAAADGRAFAAIPLIDSKGKAVQVHAQAVESQARLREFDLTAGRFPAKPDEIAVDAATVDFFKLAVNQKVSLLGKDGKPMPMTVVGTFSQGYSEGSSGGQYVLLTPEALFAQSTTKQYGAIVVAADAGAGQDQLAGRIATALPRNKVQTGAALTTAMLTKVSSGSASVTQFMLVFALVSLVVAGMVIYNTFTILIAQRTRELALLRCIGADRGQVFRGVLTEAVAMGAGASVLGFGAGIGISALLQQVVAGMGSAGGGTVTVLTPITPSVVIASFAVGVVVTVASAVVPASRATRVAPLAALRSVADGKEEVARTSALRTALIAILVLLGAGMSAVGIRAGSAADPGPFPFLITGAGAMVLLSAAIVAGPLLVGPANRLLGALPTLVFGVPAKLASANAGRNPQRTAATTAALMIGVTIVTMITVVATSAKETTGQKVADKYPYDFTVASSVGDRELPATLPDQLRRSPRIESVLAVREMAVDLNGVRRYLTGIAPNVIGTVFHPTVLHGDLSQVTATGTIAMLDWAATEAKAKVGDDITVSTDSGEQALKLVAIYGSGAGGALGTPPGLATLDTLAKLAPADTGYSTVKAKLKSGVSPQDGQAAVEKITDPIPLARVSSEATNKAQLDDMVDRMLALMGALVGLAVVIALFGIANTLSLSVLERTRESALVRALGLTRGQLRLMLLIEAALMGLMGAVSGVLLGSGFAYLLVGSVGSEDLHIDFSVPVGQLAVYLVIAVVAAFGAALLPARRAAHTPIVAGMAEA